MVIWALVRVVSLGYILGLVSLSLATLLWYFLRPRLVPAQRAGITWLILAGSFVLNSTLALVIFLGVVNQRILMTTSYFHHLMFGGWGLAITIAGAVLLLASLALTWHGWRRGRTPAAAGSTTEYLEYGGQRLRIHAAVPTICLVGAWRPELWVNREYWSGLTGGQRRIALEHESLHRLRRDNLTRLAVQYIVALYAVLPWMRGWVAAYELDCELAVDAHCRRRYPGGEYLNLVAHATAYCLHWREPVVASHLSHADQTLRLEVLAQPERGSTPAAGRLHGAAVVVLSVLPAALLLLHPVSRCLCACYLGY